ncbi:MAG: VWA domain-containing protein [Acidobacteriota bacterium]|nr:VWA domain-containing protein [Acidobacteriota bacterium]
MSRSSLSFWKNRSIYAFVAGLAGLTVLLLGGLAQAPARAQDAPPLVETIDVHLVNVDVVVTDRKGEVVRGLTAEDFELFEDGKRVKITNFSFIDRQPPEAASEDQPEPEPEADAPPPPPLHLVVYVDNRNLQPTSRNRLMPAVESFLGSRLSDQDQVMVVSFDNGLRILHPFSAEREAVVASLEPLKKGTTRAMIRGSEARRVAADLLSADDKTGADAIAQWQMFQEAQKEEALKGLNVLASFVEALAGLPGQKAVLFISEGFAMTADSRNALDRITTAANSSDVTFYALDGLGPDTAGDQQAASVNSGAEAFVNNTLTVDRRRTLQRLSDDTGGFAVTNTYNFDRGLERVGQSLASAYSLGFVPKRERDGKYHELKVKVKGRGLTVRYSTGYQDKQVVAMLADRTLAALQFDAELDNPMEVSVRRSPQAQEEWVIAIPLRHITLIPQGKLHQGQVRLLVASQRPGGALAPVKEITLPIKIPAEQMAAGGPPAIGYKVALAGDETRLAVGAQDIVARTQSFARVVVEPGG